MKNEDFTISPSIERQNKA
jgi:hypothetical protein